MSNLLWGFPGQSLMITWTAPYQNTGLYPRARIIDSAGSLSSTVNLTANATIAYLYTGSWTPPTEGDFVCVIDIYTDSGRTTLDESISGAEMNIRIKEVGGGFRGALGAARGGLKREDLARFAVNVAKEVWNLKIKGDKSAKEVLAKKSEFDPESQPVKTEIPFPEYPVSEIEDIVMRETEHITDDFKQKILNATKTIRGDIEKIKLAQVTEAINESGNGITSRLEDVFLELGKINDSFEELNSQGIIAMAKDFKLALATLSRSYENLVKELETNSKMLEALDKKEKDRFLSLLREMQSLIETLAKKIHEVNLSSVFNGFEVLNSKLKTLTPEE